MKQETIYRTAAVAVIIGALVASATTAIELVTSPYNPYGNALAINPAVHVVKYLAMILLMLGLPAMFVWQRERMGALGFGSIIALTLGLALAGTPYNVIEWSLDPALGKVEAAAALEEIYYRGIIWGLLGMPGFLGVLFGQILFAVATLKARVLPRYVPIANFVAVPVAIASMFLDTALPGLIPHPPTWMLLGLSAYGFAVLSAVAARDTVTSAPAGSDLRSAIP